MIRITKRCLIRIISFMTALFIVATTLIFTHETKINRLTADITNNTVRSVGDLQTYVSNIRSTLLKGIYSTSHKMLNSVAVKLSSDTAAARYALSDIPSENGVLGRTYTFLAQVADYSIYLSEKSGMGGEITAEETANLYSFIDYADGINEELSNLLASVKAGEINPTEDAPSIDKSLGETLSTIDESFSEYPTLVYDGPFSDHIMNKEPKILGSEEIDEASARSVAAKITGINGADLSKNEDSEGNMPAFNYSYGDVSVSISKNGGFLIYMISEKSAADQKITTDEAEIKANNFLETVGFQNLRKTYYEISDGVFYINYAYTENSVVFYPDLVKIGVSMEDGSIISFDSRGYLVNHYKRSLPEVKINAAEAEAKLPPNASLVSSSLALIPDNSTEKLCYELRCKGERGEDLLIYVNAENGEEESVLILLIGENGTLSI